MLVLCQQPSQAVNRAAVPSTAKTEVWRYLINVLLAGATVEAERQF